VWRIKNLKFKSTELLIKRTLIGSRFKDIKKNWPFCNFLVLKKIFSDKKVYLIPASSVVDPDPSLFCTDSDPCINIIYYFLTFFDNLSISQKTLKKYIFIGILSAIDEKSRIWSRIRKSVIMNRDPDPYQNLTDPQHCFQGMKQTIMEVTQ
jgi:hypothetical protein